MIRYSILDNLRFNDAEFRHSLPLYENYHRRYHLDVIGKIVYKLVEDFPPFLLLQRSLQTTDRRLLE